jgi:hypothetical protein
MRLVLDVAIEQIAVANRTSATKAKMAERILRAASDGVMDPVQLTAVTVQDGMQPAESRHETASHPRRDYERIFEP